MPKLKFKDKEYERFETSFMARIIAYRRAKNLTQKQMSELLNCSKTHVYNIESGNTKISAYHLMKWCEVLNVSPSDILGYKSDEEMMMLIEWIRTLTPSQFKIILDTVREFKDLNKAQKNA